jgi:hypothetical protein
VGYSRLTSLPQPSREASPSSDDIVYNLVKVGDEFPDALCLDGSKGKRFLARMHRMLVDFIEVYTFHHVSLRANSPHAV